MSNTNLPAGDGGETIPLYAQYLPADVRARMPLPFPYAPGLLIAIYPAALIGNGADIYRAWTDPPIIEGVKDLHAILQLLAFFLLGIPLLTIAYLWLSKQVANTFKSRQVRLMRR